MKGGCPSCILVGLLILPFEMLFKLVRRSFNKPKHDHLQIPE